MFGFKRKKPALFQPGSNIDIATRLSTLRTREFRIAYFSEDFSNNTFRYRCYNPSEAINELSKNTSASFFSYNDLAHAKEIAQSATTLVISRVRYDEKIQFLIDEFRKTGKSIYYDIDDLVFNPSKAKLVADSIGYKLRNSDEWNAWFAYISRHEATMRLCDGCITTNSTLANEIENHTNLPTRVMRNFINKEQEHYSDKIFEAKLEKNYKTDGSIKIGYFSGTPTHARDFEIALDGLMSAINTNNRVRLILAGHIETKNFSKKIKNKIEIISYQNPISLQKTISEVDINIAPLELNIFTECKSELKFFEAGIVGTMTIASPSKVFNNCITNGKNGLLSNHDEWNKNLDFAINNRNFLIATSKESQKTAKEKYSWKNNLNEILSATRHENQ